MVIAITTVVRITITVVVTVIVRSVGIIIVIDINNKVRYSSDDNCTDGAGNVVDNGICLFQFLLRIKYLQKRYYVIIQV